MEWAVTLHGCKDALVAALGATHGMMHVHVGLALYVAAQLLQGTRRGSMFALNVVVAAEVLNELVDGLAKGWMWRDTFSDVVLTLAWPVVLTAVSQYRRARWERARRAYDALVLSGLSPGQSAALVTAPVHRPRRHP